MKKGEQVITLTSIKMDGKLHLPGEKFELGKDMTVKDAKHFFERDAIDHYFEDDDTEDESASIEEMAQVKDLKSLSVKDLKAVCKHLGLKGYSSKNEADLIEMINASRNPEEIDLDAMDEDELRALAEEEGVELSEGADVEDIRMLLEAELGE